VIREILIYPDYRLMKVSDQTPVDISLEQVNDLVADLTDTLANTGNGIAIAAIQIGIPLRVMVLKVDDEYRHMISPMWMGLGDYVDGPEGCLSVPGVVEDIPRFDKVSVSYWAVEGNELALKTEGYTGILARAIQHEVEHMDGGIFLNKMPPHKRDSARQKMKKLHREAKKAGVSPGEYVYGNVGGWALTRKD
jgi:peptide deformylase